MANWAEVAARHLTPRQVAQLRAQAAVEEERAPVAPGSPAPPDPLPADGDQLIVALRGYADELRSMGDRVGVAEGRKKARQQGYTDEALVSLENFMEKNGITDYAQAMAKFERMHPGPEPEITGGGGRHSLIGDPGAADAGAARHAMAALMSGDDETFLAGMIPAALRETRGGR